MLVFSVNTFTLTWGSGQCVSKSPCVSQLEKGRKRQQTHFRISKTFFTYIAFQTSLFQTRKCVSSIHKKQRRILIVKTTGLTRPEKENKTSTTRYNKCAGTEHHHVRDRLATFRKARAILVGNFPEKNRYRHVCRKVGDRGRRKQTGGLRPTAGARIARWTAKRTHLPDDWVSSHGLGDFSVVGLQLLATVCFHCAVNDFAVRERF